MPKNVILPALGMAQDTGKILEWLKAEGEQVSEGEPIVVIETDKASVELEAPASGVLARTTAAGSEVPVAEVIAVILAPGEAVEHGAGTDVVTASAMPAATATAPDAASDAWAAPRAHSAAADAAALAGRPGRRQASPKARRMAAERGVDIAALHGSGPGGVVLAADVEAAAFAATAGSAPVAVLSREEPAVAERSEAERHPDAAAFASESALSTTWRLMAERTTQSWTTTPHFFLVREVRADRLAAWRERVQEQSAEKVTYTDLLVKVVAEGLRRRPRLNARWDAENIVPNDEVNVGIAVAVENGLVVPVIHQADDLSLSGIARRRRDLVERAQSGKLRLRDLQDATFTISNLGMYGVDAFNAIINAPQAAILAVGRIVDRVVPVDGQPAVLPMMTLSLSCDHRVVDGARGAQFLETVADLIENPTNR